MKRPSKTPSDDTDESALPSNADLARDSAGKGLLIGNNILVRYAPYIVFFHLAVGWSFRKLAKDLTEKLKPHLRGRQVSFRQVQVIVGKFRSGNLLLQDHDIADVAGSDPALASFLERWHRLDLSTAAKSPPKPKAKVPVVKKSSKTPNSPSTDKGSGTSEPEARSEVAAHTEKLRGNRERQAKLAERLRTQLRPDENS